MLNRLANLFFLLFIFFLPFRIDYLLYSTTQFYGQIDHLNFFVYLSEIFLWLSFLLFSFDFLRCPKKLAFDLFDKVFLLLLLITLVAVKNTFGALYFFRFIEVFLLFFLISKKFISFKKLINVFIYSTLFVALIGVLQFIFQHSLFFGFIGEPFLSSDIKSVAKLEVFGKELLRSYGTFSHPNVFSVYLIFALIFSIKLRYKKIVVAILGLTLILTFSKAALLAFIIFYLLGFHEYKKKWYLISPLIIALLIRFLHFGESFSERIIYLKISLLMFFENPFGIGIGNFMLFSQDFSLEKLWPWELQPVHNLFLLYLNEMGFLAFFLILFFLCIILLKTYKLSRMFVFHMMSCLIFLSFFDHYFYTSFQGQMLFFIIIALSVLDIRSKIPQLS